MWAAKNEMHAKNNGLRGEVNFLNLFRMEKKNAMCIEIFRKLILEVATAWTDEEEIPRLAVEQGTAEARISYADE